MSATKSDCSSGSTASAEGAEATTSAEVSPEMIPAAIPVNISSPSPSKTISQEFQEFEGTTIFAPSPSPTYRYSLSLKNGKLRVWLEDCESKKQWCTTELDTQDYVDSTNVIPDATASDYVECFRDLLDAAHNDATNIPSAFQRHKDGVFQLKLAVMIQVLRKSRVVAYTFILETISVERIDVLESKLRDLQDKVEIVRSKSEGTPSWQNSTIQKLEGEMKRLQKDAAGRDAVILQLKEEVKAAHLARESSLVIPLQATAKTIPSGDLICWKNSAFVFGVNAVTTGIDGVVRVDSPGTYQVAVVVNHQVGAHKICLQMMKGLDCIQSAYCAFAQNHPSSTSLMCTTHFAKNDQLTVKCPASLVGTSYLTLIRLGK
ncbi:hypothetical protein L915_07518 [Phytophthora nicotianae]|uniref:C1q domain-containing protein n=1 Tax=Phytophthora nicotianae TaxID=4792 RepID=W2GYZ6_PHYNI|nr:hypothetical protein L915_07518 [Phytophthora nicotianae]